MRLPSSWDAMREEAESAKTRDCRGICVRGRLKKKRPRGGGIHSTILQEDKLCVGTINKKRSLKELQKGGKGVGRARKQNFHFQNETVLVKGYESRLSKDTTSSTKLSLGGKKGRKASAGRNLERMYLNPISGN